MLGNYYYHQIVRKTLVSFGTLFNDIWVRHTDANDGSVGAATTLWDGVHDATAGKSAYFSSTHRDTAVVAGFGECLNINDITAEATLFYWHGDSGVVNGELSVLVCHGGVLLSVTCFAL